MYNTGVRSLSEFRYNKLIQQWVLFAPNRAKKPIKIEIKDQNNIEGKCPFCPGNEDLTPNELLRINDKSGSWACRIVPNLYNALGINTEISSSKEGNFEKRNGFGAHEVIIETPCHEKQIFDFNVDEFYNYYTAVKLRLLDLKKDNRLKYFSVFKNYGIDAGASQPHSHSQLIAMPFLPPKIKEQLQWCENYKTEHDREFFDDMIYDEKNFKKGILKENNYFLAYCPYASKYPFEIMVIAKKQTSSIHLMGDDALYALSEISRYLFETLFKKLGDFSFNMILKNGDIQNEQNPNRFHMQILPRLYKTAGFELDGDIFINTFLPEQAAKILKDN